MAIDNLKLAAWSGMAVFILSFVSSMINSFFGFGSFFTYFFIVLSSIATVLFIYGFFLLGKKYKQGMLKGFSVYFMVVAVIMMLFSLFSVPYLVNFVSYAQNFEEVEDKLEELTEKYGEDNIPEEELNKVFDGSEEIFLKIGLWLFAFYVLFFFFYGIPSIFFGVGLLKLGKDVELSKAAGVLNIVGGATTIIFVGVIVLFVAFILEMIILFKESEKKYTKRR